MIDDENYNRTYRSNQNTVQVETRHAVRSEHREEPTTDDRAHDTQNDVEKKALACTIHHFTSNEAGDQA